MKKLIITMIWAALAWASIAPSAALAGVYPNAFVNIRALRGRGASVASVAALAAISTTPSAGWCFIRCNPSYTGPLFQIDTAANPTVTFDVPQAADGTPDTGAIAAFAAGPTYRIAKVYDQYGSNDLVQATAANQMIYDTRFATGGVNGAVLDGAFSYSAKTTTALTGNGQATTTLDIAYPASSNTGQGYAQIGTTYSTAGSRNLEFGSGYDPRPEVLNTAFNTAQIAINSQPQTIVNTNAATSDTVRVNGRSATLTKGSAGTWSQAYIGYGGNGYTFGGQFFGRVIYPASLSASDAATLEASAQGIFKITPSTVGQVIFSGNSIVQGTKATSSFESYPHQADPYIAPHIDMVNAGVFGQFASSAYSGRAIYGGLKRADLSRNFFVLPEPTNDIDNYATDFATVISDTFTADRTSGTNTLLNASTTTGLSVGQRIAGALDGVARTVTAISGTTVTVSANFTTTLAGATYTARANFTGNVAVGSPTISNVSSFSGLAVGDILTATGIPAQASIASMNSGAGTITMSANATAAGTAVAINPGDVSVISNSAATLWSGSTGVRTMFTYMNGTAGFAARDILAPTTLPRSWTGGAGTSLYDQKEAVRLAYNSLLKGDQSGYGFTILDYAGIPAMANPAGANYSDGTHPNSTNFASGLQVTGNGYGYLAYLFATTINNLLAN